MKMMKFEDEIVGLSSKPTCSRKNFKALPYAYVAVMFTVKLLFLRKGSMIKY